jgi:hypothetical protein
VAGLPAIANGSSNLSKQELRTQYEMERVAWALASGFPKKKVVEALSKGDPAKAKHWRKKLQRWSVDARFQVMVQQAVHGELIMATGQITQALIRRAQRGRVDAIKLCFEMSGMWTPSSKVDHKHSGEIKVTLTSVPRPPRQEEEPVVDAEVVED